MKRKSASYLIPLAVATGLLITGIFAQNSKVPSDGENGLPLEAERNVEFTTDEGTWISLDVSPDGETIVFDLLGDIYTVPIGGGNAKQLTSGMAFESQPRYSSDGKSIVFVSDRDGSENLWIYNPAGSNLRQITKDSRGWFTSPIWSSDKSIIVSRLINKGRSAFELWLYPLEGGSGIQLTGAKTQPSAPGTEHSALGSVVSPDGRYLYYAYSTGNNYFNAAFPLWQIKRRNLATGQEDVVTNAPGSALRPALSPDGTILVYGTRFEGNTGLRIRNLSTGDERWLKYPIQHDQQEVPVASRDLLPGYAFTPNGKEMVVAYGGKIHRINLATTEDHIIPFTARVDQKIGPRLDTTARVDEGPVRARLIQGATTSPEGMRLAFSALAHVYVMKLPNGRPQRLTESEAAEFQPTWSPDGHWIAYVTWSAEQGGQIWKIRSDGTSPPQQVTRAAAYYRDPVWTPDNLRIVALRAPTLERLRLRLPDDTPTNPLKMELIWVPADGGEIHLINKAEGVSHPQFTSNNDRVYLQGGVGRSELISMRLDGTDRRSHVRIIGKDTGRVPDDYHVLLSINPDGDMILARIRDRLYLVTVPQVGSSESITVNINSPSVPMVLVSDAGADSMAWSDNGSTVNWVIGSTFFSQKLSSISSAPTVEMTETKQVRGIEIAIERPRQKPKGTLVLRGAKVITMRGDEVIENADVVITDNRITGVVNRGSVVVPDNAKILDIRGTTIVPGFIDVHDHWLLPSSVLDLRAWPLLADLAYGVTSGRDPNTLAPDTFAYEDLIDTGEMLGPRAFSTGPAIVRERDPQSLEDAINVVRKYKQYYRTNLVKSYLIGNRRQQQWMVKASKIVGVLPTTEGLMDMKLDLTHVIDGFSGNEHALSLFPLYKDVVELVAKSGISYTPTIVITSIGPTAENDFYTSTDVYNDPKARRFIPQNILDQKTRRLEWFRKDQYKYPRVAASAVKIIQAGGRVCVGGHGELPGLATHWEMWALASGGMSNMEVLRAATLSGAEAIGYAQDLGSIEVGKLADLVVLAKDPLHDIRNTNTIRYVMKNGELFEGNTLNQMWPRQKPLTPLWWWNDKP